MEPRRIAVVTESFYPATDGTTTTVKNVVDRLIDTGHEVLIVAPGPGLSTYRHSPVARIRPLDKPGGQVREALVDFGPQLVHVTSPGTLGRKALKHARRLEVPTLVVQQSPVPKPTEEYWKLKVAARADRVVATASWMQDRLAELEVPNVPLWEPGVATAAFGPQLRDDWLYGKWSRKRSRGGPYVLVGYVGSLHKRHGVRDLAEVAKVPGIRLVVIGEGPQRSWLKDRIKGAKFVGALETGELATAMASLDLLVHPGQHETCSHALREALASGVPVVAPRAGGATDVVRDDVNGVLYDATEPAALRRAVASLAPDQSRRHALGRQGRERIAVRDWVAAADELIDVHYPAAVGAHRAPAPA